MGSSVPGCGGAKRPYEHVSKVQEGGTGMVTFEDRTGYISKIGKDPYGLGRWCWTLYSGNDRHQMTRVVAAYNACTKEQQKGLADIIPTTTAILHHEKERPDMSEQAIPTAPYKAIDQMASGWGSNK